MTTARITRRLAAILATDIVGFSTRMGEDEAWMLTALRMIWRDILKPAVASHNGRVVKMMGDGALVKFSSAVDSVDCAIVVQQAMAQWNGAHPDRQPLYLRIGVNLGEIIIEGDDILGDGVNVAARLEALAPPGGVLISDSVYQQVAGKLNAEFADIGQIALKNIARSVRGWRWGGSPVEVAAVPPPPNKPSIAILPFANIGNDLENEYFADGLVEDITATLSRLSGLIVIARNASLSYRDRTMDIRQIARELGVRYLLEGSVRQGACQVRINVQLIDAEHGVHLWAERYDRDISDVFAVQDEITLRLATELQVKLIDGEQARQRYTTTTNVEAWNHYVQGLAHFRAALSRDSLARTRTCLERAHMLDPDSAPLNSSLAFIHYTEARFCAPAKRMPMLAIGKTYIDRALAIDPDNADAHTAYSMHLLMEMRYQEADVMVRRALTLTPDAADVVAFASFVFACTGQRQDALSHIQKAMRLCPYCPSSYFGYLGNALRLSERHEEAITAFRTFDARVPGSGACDLVILFQQLGRLDECRLEVERLIKFNPGFTIANWRNSQFCSEQALLEADLAALRQAGLPE